MSYQDRVCVVRYASERFLLTLQNHLLSGVLWALCWLISLINTCFQRGISREEIDRLEKVFEKGIEGYQK